jgi:hypothetical protein
LERVEEVRGKLQSLRASLNGRQSRVATVLLQSSVQQTMGGQILEKNESGKRKNLTNIFLQTTYKQLNA